MKRERLSVPRLMSERAGIALTAVISRSVSAGRGKLTKAKLKTCRTCKVKFQPFQPMQAVCGPRCAIQDARKRADKDRRRDTKVRREALKTLSDHHRDTQAVFNKWVRLRDEGQPCISCQRSTSAKRNAGHYLAVGSHPELRYHSDNCHSQCEHCNSWKSGNQAEYRPNLIDKIGQERVDILEGPHDAKQYRVDDLKEIQRFYKAEIKALEYFNKRGVGHEV